MTKQQKWQTVRLEVEDGIAWVTLDRPEKRNAMSPTLNAEMLEVLDVVDADDEAGVLVLTGAGDSFSAGMDLKEYFREVDEAPDFVQRKVRREANQWQWRRLRTFPKPTIAMVNGWCFGGAFTPLVSCDLAIAADEATFGLSEVNWGIPPGGNVSRALAEMIGVRNALHYIMTGRTFDGRRAAEMGLVNASVPRERLRSEVERARARSARQEPDRLARREDRLSLRARDGLGSGRGLSLRQARSVTLSGRRAHTQARARAVPRRQELPTRPRDRRVRVGSTAARLTRRRAAVRHLAWQGSPNFESAVAASHRWLRLPSAHTRRARCANRTGAGDRRAPGETERV